MGVYAEAWVDNRFDLEQLPALPEILNKACAMLQLDERTDLSSRLWTYDVAPSSEMVRGGLCILQGSRFQLCIGLHVIRITSDTRWRGFLLHPELRAQVRANAHCIVRALRVERIVWVPDFALERSFEESPGGLDELKTLLHTEWGPPQTTLATISQLVLDEAQRAPPEVWFEEMMSFESSI